MTVAQVTALISFSFAVWAAGLLAADRRAAGAQLLVLRPRPRPVPTWEGIRPGDIGFDEGGGAVGFLIRHGSHSPFAHCFVYVREHPDGGWWTHEAYPGGLRLRHRVAAPHKVLRVWRDDVEQRALVARSYRLVGARYAYGELVRIVVARVAGWVGVSVPPWDANPSTVICSNHAAQCVVAARPDVWLSHPPSAIWPGRLARDLDLMVWSDTVG